MLIEAFLGRLVVVRADLEGAGGSCLLGGKEKLDERLARARERAKSGGERVKNAAMATFEASRPAVGAMAVGTARAAYEEALEYAKTRTQFGRPIIDN